jgi:hypothetical protein
MRTGRRAEGKLERPLFVGFYKGDSFQCRSKKNSGLMLWAQLIEAWTLKNCGTGQNGIRRDGLEVTLTTKGINMSSRDSTSYHIMVLFSSEGYPAQDHNISTKYAKYELLLWIATDCVPRTEVLSVLYNNRCFCCSRSLGYVSVSISLSLQRF